MAATHPPFYVPPFTEDDIKDRVQYLSARCFTFIQEFVKRYPGIDLNFDSLVLINVVHSALDDIWRYKVYHLRDPDKRSDAVKRAAYFTKWIVKLRPLYVNRPPGVFLASFSKNDKTLLINEWFAISYALATLGTDANVKTITLTERQYADLLYDLHYRYVDEDALIAIYQIIVTLARGDNVVIT
jgi:hypothetical protein